MSADRDENPERKCETLASELGRMAEWLVRRGIKTVAMESTGVYWIPGQDVFEKHGIKPGDTIAIERISSHRFRVVPFAAREQRDCPTTFEFKSEPEGTGPRVIETLLAA